MQKLCFLINKLTTKLFVVVVVVVVVVVTSSDISELGRPSYFGSGCAYV